MGRLRQDKALRIKKYMNGHNQSTLSVKSNADIFKTPVTITQDVDNNRVIIKRASIDDNKKMRTFTLSYNTWQISITSVLPYGEYELEPDECDTDTMTYYLTE